MDRTDWPDALRPDVCPIALRTERVVDATPSEVWRWLVRADLWPRWFAGARAVRCSSGHEVQHGARVRWWLDGAPAHATVRRLRPAELLEWEGGGMGVRAYHSWRLEPLGARTRVVSVETARGAMASLLRPYVRGVMARSHQRCLDRLAELAPTAPPPPGRVDDASPLAAHHLRYFARNLAAHRDPRNRRVHLIATLVGFQCLVSMLARVAVGPTNLGALLALATVLYVLPFEPLAAAVVAATTLAARLALGPRFGQAHAGPVAGLAVPLAVFLAFNLTGVYTHRLFADPIIDRNSQERLIVRLGKTLHTILFSSVHFVTFALLGLGYRPQLRRRLEAATGVPIVHVAAVA